jgi:hypothetical protein
VIACGSVDSALGGDGRIPRDNRPAVRYRFIAETVTELHMQNKLPDEAERGRLYHFVSRTYI